MLNDPLAAALVKILNAERVGKREVLVKPASKLMKKILTLMQEQRFIGVFEELEGGAGTTIKINLIGNINKCGVIKPRFSTKHKMFEKWEKRYLPAKDFGLIFVSTPQGVLTHVQAKENKTGGKLLAYCY
jgi:small subunit ribosomal protein S8